MVSVYFVLACDVFVPTAVLVVAVVEVSLDSQNHLTFPAAKFWNIFSVMSPLAPYSRFLDR